MKYPFVVVAHNLRSLYNIGSLFRTADALGVEKIFLVGSSGHPHPAEPWRRDHRELHKTALGAELTVAWEYYPAIKPLISQLKSQGYHIISLETTEKSRPLTSWQVNNHALALIFGNEVHGIPPEVLEQSDTALHIPMRGHKESLNVSVSFAIAAFWLLNHKLNPKGKPVVPAKTPAGQHPRPEDQFTHG